jgi:hypothetical protein
MATAAGLVLSTSSRSCPLNFALQIIDFSPVRPAQNANFSFLALLLEPYYSFAASQLFTFRRIFALSCNKLQVLLLLIVAAHYTNKFCTCAICNLQICIIYLSKMDAKLQIQIFHGFMR